MLKKLLHIVNASPRVSCCLPACTPNHPVLQVACYHVSTMSISERSALAKSWLAESATPEDAAAVDQAADDSSSSSGQSGSGTDAPPDSMLETWIILQFCERGSLDRAVKLGKFLRKTDGQPEMVRSSVDEW